MDRSGMGLLVVLLLVGSAAGPPTASAQERVVTAGLAGLGVGVLGALAGGAVGGLVGGVTCGLGEDDERVEECVLSVSLGTAWLVAHFGLGLGVYWGAGAGHGGEGEYTLAGAGAGALAGMALAIAWLAQDDPVGLPLFAVATPALTWIGALFGNALGHDGGARLEPSERSGALPLVITPVVSTSGAQLTMTLVF